MNNWLNSDEKQDPWNAISVVGLPGLDIPSRMEQKQKQLDTLSKQVKFERFAERERVRTWSLTY